MGNKMSLSPFPLSNRLYHTGGGGLFIEPADRGIQHIYNG